jgi:hypothetical protein
MPEALPVEKTQWRAKVETHFKRSGRGNQEKREVSTAAKNLPTNGLQKPGKPAILYTYSGSRWRLAITE